MTRWYNRCKACENDVQSQPTPCKLQDNIITWVECLFNQELLSRLASISWSSLGVMAKLRQAENVWRKVLMTLGFKGLHIRVRSWMYAFEIFKFVRRDFSRNCCKSSMRSALPGAKQLSHNFHRHLGHWPIAKHIVSHSGTRLQPLRAMSDEGAKAKQAAESGWAL